jgi:hypothetical protein
MPPYEIGYQVKPVGGGFYLRRIFVKVRNEHRLDLLGKEAVQPVILAIFKAMLDPGNQRPQLAYTDDYSAIVIEQKFSPAIITRMDGLVTPQSGARV